MHILVTGAARGIGAAVVRRALAVGHTAVACDLDGETLAATWAETGGVTLRQLDVADADAWQQVFASVWAEQPVDVLVNVAGVLRAGVTGELQAREVALQFEVNTLGVIYGTNAAAALMVERGRGHIINVGSTAGLFATPGNAVYAASKHAVRGFTIAAAGDLRPRGVDVSLVAPTAVKTAMLESQRGDRRAALTFEGKRALSADEVADAIVTRVMEKKPLELYLPGSDYWTGRLCSAFPEFFLRVAEKAREKGVRNFNSAAFGTGEEVSGQ